MYINAIPNLDARGDTIDIVGGERSDRTLFDHAHR